MNYKELFKRAILLISSPAKAWEEISLEEDRRKVVSTFVYPMIGFCGLAVFIGTLLDDGMGSFVFQKAMTECCSVFVALFGGYFVASYIINRLGVAMFRLEDNILLVQQFAGYAMVVTFLLDIITGLFSGFFILRWIFQFYIIYIVWEGSQVLIRIDEKNQMSYTVMVSLLLIFCPAVLEFVFNKLTLILN